MTDTITRVWDRLTSAIRLGRITNVDESRSVQRVQIQFNDMETRDNIPALQFYGFAASPPVGTNVVVINQSGHSGASIAIGTIDPRVRPTGLGPGESKQHDNSGQYVHLQGGSKIVIHANSEVDITCSSAVNITAPEVKVTGVLKVTGHIEVNGVTVAVP